MPAGANTQQQLLSEGELDAIVAPIALYGRIDERRREHAKDETSCP
jgi:hypothetical protein